jgi:hypothetical protein
MRRLLHRWFVRYNPIYLVSAAIVLRGVNLISHGLLAAGHTYAELGGPAIAELYAWALIGAAALLMRVGLRRPAVLLALLAVLYQGDLTLHTETCVFLGGIGWVAALVWLASFVLKLFALARAMGLRPSPSAIGVPTFGAAGLVVVPHLLVHASETAASATVGFFLFAIFGAALATARRVDCTFALDAWGETVRRRALGATWALWGVLVLLHVAFWFSQLTMDAFVLVPTALLLATRFAKRNWQAWTATLATIVWVGCVAPALLWFAAALGVLAFASRVHRDPRTLTGALACAYLAVWTAGWCGGPLPAHLLVLDAALAIGLVPLAWRLRSPGALAPLTVALGHLAVQRRLVTAPVTPLEWGAWLVGTGFFLLLGTVGASVTLHLRAAHDGG